MYAILSHGGRQHRVSAGDRLVVDRLSAEVGSVIALEPVLLTGGEGTSKVGSDVEGTRVAVTVVKHLRGEKLRVFKYKAKKRSRKVAGYRSDLTELRVEAIVAKGAALPRAAATEAAPHDATTDAAPAPRAVAARTTKTAQAAAAETPAGTAKRATKAPATPTQPSAKAAMARDEATAAKPKPPAATKAAPAKRASRATGKGKESDDGA